MFKNKHFLKEVIALSFAVFTLAALARQGNRLIDTAFNRVAFPANASIFENFKVYFTAITVLVIIEYFIAFEYPNNYLLSRVARGACDDADNDDCFRFVLFKRRKNLHSAFLARRLSLFRYRRPIRGLSPTAPARVSL